MGDLGGRTGDDGFFDPEPRLRQQVRRDHATGADAECDPARRDCHERHGLVPGANGKAQIRHRGNHLNP